MFFNFTLLALLTFLSTVLQRATRQSGEERKPSPRIFSEAEGIALIEIRGEGNAYAFSLPSIVYRRTSYIPLNERFAALQIDFIVRGWKRQSAHTK